MLAQVLEPGFVGASLLHVDVVLPGELVPEHFLKVQRFGQIIDPFRIVMKGSRCDRYIAQVGQAEGWESKAETAAMLADRGNTGQSLDECRQPCDGTRAGGTTQRRRQQPHPVEARDQRLRRRMACISTGTRRGNLQRKTPGSQDAVSGVRKSSRRQEARAKACCAGTA